MYTQTTAKFYLNGSCITLVKLNERAMSKFSVYEKDFYDDRLFVINKKYLCFIGLWPFQKTRKRILIMIIWWTGIITVVIPEVFMK